MKKKKNTPAIVRDAIYIGIDPGKNFHHATFISSRLLAAQRGQYTKCPCLRFENSRTGFEALLIAIHNYGDPAHCSILIERTGHYAVALEQFLTEQGIQLYRVQAKERYQENKTDLLDSLSLAIKCYTQIGLCAPVVDKKERIRAIVPPSETARILYGLVQQRTDFMRALSRYRNQLTALADQMFPEFTQVYSDPNGIIALEVRLAFPTPDVLAAASDEDIYSKKIRDAKKILALRDLAGSSIGTHDKARLLGLRLQQEHLIEHCQLLRRQLKHIDQIVEDTISRSRDGRIIASLPGFGTIQTALFLSYIGSIANFPTPGDLRGFFGWAPRFSQTGETMDSVSITRGGSRQLKAAIYLAAINAANSHPLWMAFYLRLQKRLCRFDEKEGDYVGKTRALSHVIGSMTRVMFHLLRKDYLYLQSLAPGETPREPELYDPGKHKVLRVIEGSLTDSPH